MRAQLMHEDVHFGCKRVAGQTCMAALCRASRARGKLATRPHAGALHAPDWVRRDFGAGARNPL
jgi:hypothetical protein